MRIIYFLRNGLTNNWVMQRIRYQKAGAVIFYIKKILIQWFSSFHQAQKRIIIRKKGKRCQTQKSKNSRNGGQSSKECGHKRISNKRTS